MREMEGLKTGSDDEMPPTPPRPATPSVAQKALPWKPKVRYVVHVTAVWLLCLWLSRLIRWAQAVVFLIVVGNI